MSAQGSPREMARPLHLSGTNQNSGVQTCVISLQLLRSNLRGIVMSRLNFDVRRYQRAPRRRSYNPRGKVAIRTPVYLSGLYLFAVATAMLVSFAVVWYA